MSQLSLPYPDPRNSSYDGLVIPTSLGVQAGYAAFDRLQGGDKNPRLAAALRVRNIEAEPFINASLNDVPHFHLMPGGAQVLERFHRWQIEKLPVAIFGDLDNDGIFFNTIVHNVCDQLSMPVAAADMWCRKTEVFGVPERFAAQLKELGVRRLIVGDLGSEIANLERLFPDTEIIVLDHHHTTLLKQTENISIANPCATDSSGIKSRMCTGAIAWSFARSVLPTGAPDLLCYAALATVADLTPMDEPANRAIVREGIKALSRPHSLGAGLQALFSELGVKQITSAAIGYVIGSAVNAPGRMFARVDEEGRPLAVSLLELFQTSDLQRATKLVRTIVLPALEARKAREELALFSILEELGELKAVFEYPFFMWHGNYDPGTVGIICARLAEELNITTLISTLKMFGKGTASQRSRRAQDISHIHAQAHDEEAARLNERPVAITDSRGGHTGAGGINYSEEFLIRLKHAYHAAGMELYGTENVLKRVPIDGVTTIKELRKHSEQWLTELAPIEPTGRNVDPINFIVPDVRIHAIKQGKRKINFSLTLNDATGYVLRANYFHCFSTDAFAIKRESGSLEPKDLVFSALIEPVIEPHHYGKRLNFKIKALVPQPYTYQAQRFRTTHRTYSDQINQRAHTQLGLFDLEVAIDPKSCTSFEAFQDHYWTARHISPSTSFVAKRTQLETVARCYERERIMEERFHLRESHVMQIGTGGGKTLRQILWLFKGIDKGEKVLALVPSAKLARQFAKEVHKLVGTDFDVGILTGEDKIHIDSSFLIATPEALHYRVVRQKIDPAIYKRVSIDECHRIVGRSAGAELVRMFWALPTPPWVFECSATVINAKKTLSKRLKDSRASKIEFDKQGQIKNLVLTDKPIPLTEVENGRVARLAAHLDIVKARLFELVADSLAEPLTRGWLKDTLNNCLGKDHTAWRPTSFEQYQKAKEALAQVDHKVIGWVNSTLLELEQGERLYHLLSSGRATFLYEIATMMLQSLRPKMALRRSRRKNTEQVVQKESYAKSHYSVRLLRNGAMRQMCDEMTERTPVAPLWKTFCAFYDSTDSKKLVGDGQAIFKQAYGYDLPEGLSPHNIGERFRLALLETLAKEPEAKLHSRERELLSEVRRHLNSTMFILGAEISQVKFAKLLIDHRIQPTHALDHCGIIIGSKHMSKKHIEETIKAYREGWKRRIAKSSAGIEGLDQSGEVLIVLSPLTRSQDFVQIIGRIQRSTERKGTVITFITPGNARGLSPDEIRQSNLLKRLKEEKHQITTNDINAERSVNQGRKKLRTHKKTKRTDARNESSLFE